MLNRLRAVPWEGKDKTAWRDAWAEIRPDSLAGRAHLQC
jgi:hypothetical protein